MNQHEGARYCNDYGDNPACERDVDDRYTMDFTDIGEGYIYWCSKCGSVAHAMQAGINEAFATRPGFVKEFKVTIDSAKAEQAKS